jgi:hypothetical protein
MNEATDAASSLDNDKTTNISHLFLRRQIVNSEENVSTRKARFFELDGISLGSSVTPSG